MKTFELMYSPTEKQKLYHVSAADELLYGGAAGGGKSAATVVEAGLLCLEHPGIHCYLFRRTYPELEQSLIGEAFKFWSGVGHYVGREHTWKFPNGSEMRFRHCQYEKDRFLYQGAEIHALFIDELTHFSAQIVDYLQTRVRAEKRLNFTPRKRYTSNPGGIGHAWVKKKFVDLEPFKMNRIEIRSEELKKTKLVTRQYIPARVMDNPHITEDYIFEMEQKPPALRRALLEGSWDAFEGQCFYEWRDDPEHYYDGIRTHVVAPREIPKSWPRYRSFDWGYTKPFSVLWWAVDEYGRAWLYREWYGSSAPNVGLKMTVQEVARGIKQREALDGEVIGWADPAIWDSSTGESVNAMMNAEGVYWLKGDNARLAGKMQLHRRLAFDENGRPGMYVFSGCREFIRCIPALVYSETKTEDVDTDGEDHCYDAARYFLMARPMTAEILPEERLVDEIAPDDQMRSFLDFGK